MTSAPTYHDVVKRKLRGARLSLNTWAMRRGLWKLPRLVKRQRRLERLVARFEKYSKREKATREEIHALLVAQGLGHGEGVTCLGYDVVRWKRAGGSKVDPDRLRACGVPEVDIQFATVTGAEASFATVRPMKGAEVLQEAA